MSATLDTLQAAIERLAAEVQQLKAAIPTQLVDARAAADHLGISVRTLRRMVAEARVPYRRIGRAVRFDLARLAPIGP